VIDIFPTVQNFHKGAEIIGPSKLSHLLEITPKSLFEVCYENLFTQSAVVYCVLRPIAEIIFIHPNIYLPINSVAQHFGRKIKVSIVL
jgi:hypothetical protein